MTKSEKGDYFSPGLHGYAFDQTEEMNAIFLANGNSFSKGTHPKFENVQVYGIICKVLEISCAPNNGTGLHNLMA